MNQNGSRGCLPSRPSAPQIDGSACDTRGIQARQNNGFDERPATRSQRSGAVCGRAISSDSEPRDDSPDVLGTSTYRDFYLSWTFTLLTTRSSSARLRSSATATTSTSP